MFLKRVLYIFLLPLALLSCSKYQKILKSHDGEKKFEAAEKYYNEGDYFRAMTIYEDLISAYRATKKAEIIYLHYAYCHFNQEDYELAAFHFENFTKTFTTSEYLEESQFMVAYSYYMNSPGPTLDQDNTVKAINNLQLFINRFPQSSKITQCNDLIDMLRDKLQTKDYNNARLYYDMGDYKSSAIAFRNLLKDYPGNKFREESLYLIVKSYYLLAGNSIESKKEERYKAAIQAYFNLIDNFPGTKYLKEISGIYNQSQVSIDRIKRTSVN